MVAIVSFIYDRGHT